MNRNEIEVLIDELTPCLIHRESGEEYSTVIESLKLSDLNRLTHKQGWVNFDWKKEYSSPNRHVYKLMVLGLTYFHMLAKSALNRASMA
ncbi:hypothetical protein ACE41H_24835 [Paenibacillus enshidis]|uniref:Uncharacterized protein n=1 Tax=Paenibacillus enshidis TaxID=1458439 RepID=A0ABV5B0H9_9BACL